MQLNVKVKKVKESIAVNGTPSHSYGVSPAVWDRTVLPATLQSTQANTPRLHPSQPGWYSIYRPFKGGGLSKPRPRVQRTTGPLLLRDSPEPARTEHTALRLLVQHANH